MQTQTPALQHVSFVTLASHSTSLTISSLFVSWKYHLIYETPVRFNRDCP